MDNPECPHCKANKDVALNNYRMERAEGDFVITRRELISGPFGPSGMSVLVFYYNECGYVSFFLDQS